MSLEETEGSLVHLVSAFQVDWRRVNQRLRTHPHEARELIGGHSSVLHRVLQRRRSNYPPFQTARTLLTIFPESSWIGISEHNSPLHVICRSNPVPEYLALLRSTRPSVSNDTKALLYLWEYHVNAFGSEQELVSFLTEGSREAARIYVDIASLIEYTQTAQLRPDLLIENNILHTIAALTPDLELLQIALQVFRGQAGIQDKNGSFPLHTFLATKANGRPLTFRHDFGALSFRFPFDLLPLLRIVAQAHPEAIMARDFRGQLPLHIAIEAGWDEFDILLRDHPDSLEAPEGQHGWLPFQLAALSPESSLETVYSLLRKSPSVLYSATHRPVTEEQDGDELRVASGNEVSETSLSQPAPLVSEDLLRFVLKVGETQSPRLWKSLQAILTRNVSTSNRGGMLQFLAGLPHCPKSLLQTMVHFHRSDMGSLDSMGRLPLHWLVTVGRIEERDYKDQGDADETCPYVERLEYLLQMDPSACWHRDHAGQMPLHLAAGLLPLPGLQRLIEASPRILREPDGITSLPPVLSGAIRMTLDEIYLLLHAAPDVISTR